MLRNWLLFLGLVLAVIPGLRAQTLSSGAQISVYTAGPGNELYSVFGHSAIRVLDLPTGTDRVYNYGTFDFNAPGFYLNFIRGKLLYMLSVSDVDSFLYPYVAERRYLYEQVLNLDQAQKQKLFDFLEENYLPANRFYAYDFFFDNCSTRIRDALEVALGDQLTFTYPFVQADQSFRDLIDPYLLSMPWADLGIDLGLGLPTDRTARPREYLFLPEYLFEALHAASISNGAESRPLVSQTIHLYEAGWEAQKPFFAPSVVFWLIALIVGWITYLDYRQGRFSREMDAVLFGLAGLTGVVLLFLWFATDHQATRPNLNILWAWPTHLLILPWLVRRKVRPLVRGYFRISGIAMLVLLLSWFFLPQDLHEAFIPIILSMTIRSFFIARLPHPFRGVEQRPQAAGVLPGAE